MIHAITATWAFDKAKKRKKQPQQCPKCNGKPAAPFEKQDNEIIISCENCGNQVSPQGAGEMKDETKK